MKRTIYYGNETWVLHEDGAIERPRCFGPDAKRWRVVGAVRVNNFGQEVERASLADILAGKVKSWTHKNGKQSWHVIDFDHGTHRVWMSPQHRIA